VEHNARLMFCDHESGLESFMGGSPPDCSGEEHHTSIVAHVCWLNVNAKQVTCTGPSASIGASSDPLWASYQNRHQPGSGLYECSGREVVENYLLPKSFMAQFSNLPEGAMTKENWQDGRLDTTGVGSDIHSNSHLGTRDNAYFLAEQHFALLADSWALNTNQESTPDNSTGELFDRTRTVFTGTGGYGSYQTAASDFVTRAKQDLLGGAAPGPAEVTEPKLSVTTQMPPSQAINQEGSSSSYFNVPWKDWEGDAYQRTHQDRGQFYLGCRGGEEC
jgi:hypothetical protein